jgi:hypothetical protein
MKCWNCDKEIPAGAKSCKFCEAKVKRDEPDISPKEAMSALQAAGLTGEMLDEMKELARNAETAEEFADSIFIGNCPKCGSEEVANCEETSEIEDVTVARCFGCGLFWCSECGYEMKAGETECPHWKLCEACAEQEDCPYLMETDGCPKIAEWLEAAAKGPKGQEGAPDDDRNPDGDDD